MLRWINFILLVACVLLTPSMHSYANQQVTYHYPITFIGADGNLYMTSLNAKEPPTLVMQHAEHLRLGNVRWSPDGSRFVVAEYGAATNFDPEQSNLGSKLYLVESGKAPVWLSQADIGEPALSAWSPDGSNLTYFKGQFDMTNATIEILPLSGHQPDEANLQLGFCYGDSPFSMDESNLYIDEQGEASPYAASYTISWTPFGILAASSCGSPRMVLVSPTDQGRQELNLGELENYSLPTISPDIRQALISVFVEAAPSASKANVEETQYDDFYTVDLKTGKPTKLFSAENATPIGWSSKGQYIYYTTETRSLVIQGQEGHDQVGKQFFNDWPNVTSQWAIITLWQRRSDGSGSPRQLYRREGYLIGAFATMPDDSAIVFSFITSAARRIEAINAGQSEQQISKFDTAHVEIISISFTDGSVRRIALGGQPTIGSGDFTINTP